MLYLVCLRKTQDARIQAVPAQAGCKVGRREAVGCSCGKPGARATCACLEHPFSQAVIRRNGCQVQRGQPGAVPRISLHKDIKCMQAPSQAEQPACKHTFESAYTGQQGLLSASCCKLHTMGIASLMKGRLPLKRTCHW